MWWGKRREEEKELFLEAMNAIRSVAVATAAASAEQAKAFTAFIESFKVEQRQQGWVNDEWTEWMEQERRDKDEGRKTLMDEQAEAEDRLKWILKSPADLG